MRNEKRKTRRNYKKRADKVRMDPAGSSRLTYQTLDEGKKRKRWMQVEMDGWDKRS